MYSGIQQKLDFFKFISVYSMQGKRETVEGGGGGGGRGEVGKEHERN